MGKSCHTGHSVPFNKEFVFATTTKWSIKFSYVKYSLYVSICVIIFLWHLVFFCIYLRTFSHFLITRRLCVKLCSFLIIVYKSNCFVYLVLVDVNVFFLFDLFHYLLVSWKNWYYIIHESIKQVNIFTFLSMFFTKFIIQNNYKN